ncbi:hypothetical protein BDV18DRAFT_98755 [Aspergillus unguis]
METKRLERRQVDAAHDSDSPKQTTAEHSQTSQRNTESQSTVKHSRGQSDCVTRLQISSPYWQGLRCCQTASLYYHSTKYPVSRVILSIIHQSAESFCTEYSVNVGNLKRQAGMFAVNPPSILKRIPAWAQVLSVDSLSQAGASEYLCGPELCR